MTRFRFASMRPAQKAPENVAEGGGRQSRGAASMRPAQKAPENGVGRVHPAAHGRRFNEAGAKSAGKHSRTLDILPSFISCFNEAGAKSAGKPAHS